MNFEPGYRPIASLTDKSFCFFFSQDKLLVKAEKDFITIPQFDKNEAESLHPHHLQFLGTLDGFPCLTGEIDETLPVNTDLTLAGLRGLFQKIEHDLFFLGGRAFHIMNWSRNNMFCGRCGCPMDLASEERAKKCNHCDNTVYPRISPAAIVAVTRENRILLARATRFTTSFYSVLAGFVEPGETIEECAAREIKEEVGITIKNLKYFGSQPWPFPDSLMIGFTAEYDSGEVIVDTRELVDAKWFSPDELPDIPSSISIARKLIDWFINNRK